jgi:rod shape-determining protein MreC
MEALLSRYRNLTVLLIVVLAQLLYLAYQVKTNRDERLIRVWAVTAVTPMAGVVEVIRHNTIGFLEDYFILLDVREQNRKLKAENDQLRMENVYFRNQLATAEHARALVLFQAQSPSKTVAARVVGNSTVSTAKAVFIDRGSTSGIQRGMAVVTPDGIVGKVVAVYPLVSQVLLVTDATFKVGIESQKGHVHGVLNCASGKCVVEQIQNEDKVAAGEWFFTSGEDRIFPKGFPVGTVTSAEPGQGMKDVKLRLTGAPAGTDEVLVVLRGVHHPIPAAPPVEETMAPMLEPPPPDSGSDASRASKSQTEADRILQKYDALGKEEGHVYGAVGSSIPDFNLKRSSQPKPPQTQPVQSATSQQNKPEQKKPESRAPTAATTATAPAILGARSSPTPSVPKPANTQAQPNMSAEPALPLGAPRRRSPAPKVSPEQPSTPAQQPPPQL